MSQAGILNISGGGGGGSPIESLTGDSGGPVFPTANNINILGDDSTVNNNNGITVVGTPGTSTQTVTLTNRYSQTANTVGAVTATVTILSGLADGTYTLDMSVAAYATAGGPAGNGYTIVGAVRSTSGVATLITNQQKDSFEETIGANAVMGVSGNTITVTFTGVALFTFDWIVTGTYTFIA
jgi:hypothetical protein